MIRTVGIDTDFPVVMAALAEPFLPTAFGSEQVLICSRFYRSFPYNSATRDYALRISSKTKLKHWSVWLTNFGAHACVVEIDEVYVCLQVLYLIHDGRLPGGFVTYFYLRQ